MTPIKIKASDMWQTTSLDCMVAEELFGWRWLAYHGRPTNDHPQYPIDNIPVRRFFPPDSDLDPSWFKYFEEHPVSPATGDEALAYCYCSSSGPHMVPHFSGHMEACRDMEKEICRRKLWDDYENQLAVQCGAARKDGTINTRKFHFADCESRCIAALVVVGSKYVTREQPAGGA